MNKRPKSVTVISWILIVMGGFSIIPILSMGAMDNPKVAQLMSQSPLPVSVQYGMMYLGILVTFVSGVAMLFGKNWARFLYVGWSVIGFIIAIFTSPVKAMMIPGIIIFAIAAFFLFRPKANEYFASAAGR